MVRILQQVGLGMVAALALLIAADFARWKIVAAKGNGYDTVQVSRMSVASLKNKKEEYYFDGFDQMPCTRSTLPMPVDVGWSIPCWWLRSHHSVVTRY